MASDTWEAFVQFLCHKEPDYKFERMSRTIAKCANVISNHPFDLHTFSGKHVE